MLNTFQYVSLSELFPPEVLESLEINATWGDADLTIVTLDRIIKSDIIEAILQATDEKEMLEVLSDFHLLTLDKNVAPFMELQANIKKLMNENELENINRLYVDLES